MTGAGGAALREEAWGGWRFLRVSRIRPGAARVRGGARVVRQDDQWRARWVGRGAAGPSIKSVGGGVRRMRISLPERHGAYATAIALLAPAARRTPLCRPTSRMNAGRARSGAAKRYVSRVAGSSPRPAATCFRAQWTDSFRSGAEDQDVYWRHDLRRRAARRPRGHQLVRRGVRHPSRCRVSAAISTPRSSAVRAKRRCAWPTPTRTQ